MNNFIIYQPFRYFPQANVKILLCFFLFLTVFNNFFTIPEVIKNAKQNLTLAIHTDAPIIVANKSIEMIPLFADKTIKYLSKQSKKQYIY